MLCASGKRERATPGSRGQPGFSKNEKESIRPKKEKWPSLSDQILARCSKVRLRARRKVVPKSPARTSSLGSGRVSATIPPPSSKAPVSSSVATPSRARLLRSSGSRSGPADTSVVRRRVGLGGAAAGASAAAAASKDAGPAAPPPPPACAIAGGAGAAGAEDGGSSTAATPRRKSRGLRRKPVACARSYAATRVSLRLARSLSSSLSRYDA